MKPELDVYDRLHIAEIVGYKHISAPEQKELLAAIDECRAAVLASGKPAEEQPVKEQTPR